MSSPFIAFSDSSSCSACPAGTKVTLATAVPNDETSCMLVGVYDKMPDGCKGKVYDDRSCYPKKAVDDLLQDYRDNSGNVVGKPSTAGTKSVILATYGPFKDWDMSEVTNMHALFFQKRTFNADLSSWDVSRVTTMDDSTSTNNFNPSPVLCSFSFV